MAELTDMTIEILKQIRDEIRATRSDLSARIDQTNERLDATRMDLASRIEQTNERLDHSNARLDGMEGAMLDLATQQRFVVKHSRENRDRELRLETELDELRRRVDVIEVRLPGGK